MFIISCGTKSTEFEFIFVRDFESWKGFISVKDFESWCVFMFERGFRSGIYLELWENSFELVEFSLDPKKYDFTWNLSTVSSSSTFFSSSSLHGIIK